MRVIATAGHVDHGKSTLVLALTGTDPDRWQEEKTRGLTIDLGFAQLSLGSGQEIAFIDVPGHERFIKNMLAGVGGIDACLFVVAATEGWMPQSEEHLRILDLLGVERGLIALTKAALAGPELQELAAGDVRAAVRGTFLETAEIIPVDAPAGRGITELTAALDRLVSSTPPAADRGRPRLWIDRSFPVRGAGCVVTGTLAGGPLTAGEHLLIEPGAHEVRVRGLQSHYSWLDSAAPGRRLAVNLTGISHRDVQRGQALVRPGEWQLTGTLDASLTVLGALGHPVTGRGAYMLHLGSASLPARLRVIGASRIEPGEQRAVRIWLADGAQVPAVPGDRYVLRESGRSETVGGGEILDVDPRLPVSRAAPSRSAARVIAERGWVDVGELTRLTGEVRDPDVGHWAVDTAAVAASRAQIIRACREAGSRGVNLAHFDERERALLAAGIDGICVQGDRALDEAAITGTLSEPAAAALAALRESPWSPPVLPLSDRGALRELERSGDAVQSGDIWFAAAAVDAAAAALARLLDGQPDGFTVAAARDTLGTSRRYVLPLLARLDATGVTRRKGDLRTAGPRMPPVGTDGRGDEQAGR